VTRKRRVSEQKTLYSVHMKVSDAEQRLLMRLRQLPAGAHLLTLRMSGCGPQEVSIWLGTAERLEKVDIQPIM
jgi:hypothetical protein